jgi:chemotaxis protein MotB
MTVMPPVPTMPDISPGSARAHRTTELTAARAGTKRGSGLGLWLTFLLLIAAGAAGFYGYTQLEEAVAEAEGAKGQLQGAMVRAARAEQQAMAVTAELTRSQTALEQSKASLLQAEAAAAQSESELEAKLASLLEEGQGQVTKGKDGRLTLELVDKVLFRSGQADLTARGKKVMARVGSALAEMHGKQVWVQGHTDDVPIKEDNQLFASNWELSAARALTVVHFLQDDSQVDPTRLAAAAFGSHRPVSRRQKAKNRRIEIVLFPSEVKLER